MGQDRIKQLLGQAAAEAIKPLLTPETYIGVGTGSTANYFIAALSEIDPSFSMTKGGGGALTREKIVASAAAHFICIADQTKWVKRLGQFPLPIEVIPMSRSTVARQLVALGGTPVLRENFLTDNGNEILDVHDLEIDDPAALEAALNHLPGIVTNGLFALRPADQLLMDADGQIQTYRVGQR